MRVVIQKLVQATVSCLILIASGGPAACGQPASLVKDINPSMTGSSSSPFEFTYVNGLTFFVARDLLRGEELWRTDGTPAGTFLVKDIFPGPSFSSPRELTNVNGTLFFVANEGGATRRELWKSDGSELGTVLVKDIRTGIGSSSPQELHRYLRGQRVKPSQQTSQWNQSRCGPETTNIVKFGECGRGDARASRPGRPHNPG